MKQKLDFNKPITTVGGIIVNIFTTQASGYWPVVGQVSCYEHIYRWDLYGKSEFSVNSEFDLVNIKEKKIVPLEPQDIKPGNLVKYKKEKDTWMLITAVKINALDTYYFVAGGKSDYFFNKDLKNLLISYDNGKNWHEMTKEIEE